MDSLEEWVALLRQTEKLIIVEGRKDKEALAAYGVPGVVTIAQKSFYAAVEGIAAAAREVIILTDLDREGKGMYKKLCSHLQKRGVKIDHVFREFLFKKTHLTQIEGLPHYALRTSCTASKMGTPVLKL